MRPALLTRMSMPPKAALTPSHAAASCASSVVSHWNAAPPTALRDLLRFVAAQVEDADLHAFFRQPFGGCLAQAARSTGDDCRPPFESSHRSFLRSLFRLWGTPPRQTPSPQPSPAKRARGQALRPAPRPHWAPTRGAPTSDTLHTHPHHHALSTLTLSPCRERDQLHAPPGLSPCRHLCAISAIAVS